MTIKAEAHSDDYVIEVDFDATPWFAQASDEEIAALAAIDWGGDYESDEVADYCSDVPGLVRLFDYLDNIRDDPMKKDCCGFECHVDEESALNWLQQYRPLLWQQLKE